MGKKDKSLEKKREGGGRGESGNGDTMTSERE